MIYNYIQFHQLIYNDRLLLSKYISFIEHNYLVKFTIFSFINI